MEETELAGFALFDHIDSEGIKDDNCHKSFYAELKRMILDKMAEHGMDWYTDDDEDDEDEE